jgi:hypothetical protein
MSERSVNSSLVPACRVKPPEELQAFFDDPPLVGSERRSDYDAFLSAIATAVPPVDAIDWILLYDLVCKEWEIRREGRMKAEIIKFHQKEVVAELLKATFDKTDRLGSAENRIFVAPTEAGLWASDPEARAKIDRKLEERGHDPASVLAQAYMRGASDIDVIDRRLASYELRRIAVLREIGLRSEKRAQKTEKAVLDVIEGDFSEAAE